MTVSLVAAGSVLAVLFTLVFARELQRRRALESLLSNILTYWRSHDAEERAVVPDAAVPDAVDTPDADRDWMRRNAR